MIKIEVNDEELNIIVNAIAELPFKQVYGLMVKIQQQVADSKRPATARELLNEEQNNAS